MILILFPVSLGIFVLLNRVRKKSYRNPSSAVLMYYFLFGCFAAYFVKDSNLVGFEVDYLVFILSILLYLTPVLFFNDHLSVIQPNLTSDSRFIKASNIVLIACAFSFIWFSRYLGVIFEGDVGLNRVFLTQGQLLVDSGVYNTLASASASLYILALIFSFQMFCSDRSHLLYGLILYIVSLCYPLNVLSYYGRTGIYSWIFVNILCYIYYQKSMNKVAKKYFKIFTSSLLALLLTGFILITISRFQHTEKGTLYWTIYYFSQGLDNYLISRYYQYFDMSYFGRGSFPLIYEILQSVGLAVDIDVTERSYVVSQIYRSGGDSTRVFGTFVKSFNEDMGLTFTFTLGIVISLITINARKNNKISLKHDILYMLYFMFLGEGILYFIMGSRQGNLLILSHIYFAYLLSYKRLSVSRGEG